MRRGGASVVKARIATATAKQRPLTIPSHPARVAGILRSVSASRSLNAWRSFPPISGANGARSEEHTSELQSLMRISYAVFCLKKKKRINYNNHMINSHTNNDSH